MKVNSVSNVSFSGKKIDKELKAKNKENYYRYVSQFHANDALKLSVGREVEDGKYKAASAATLFAGFLGTCVSMIASSNVSAKARALRASENVTQKAVNKLTKQAAATQIGFIASSLAVLASIFIKDANNAKANKTANERGFLSDADYRQINDKQATYELTNFINKAHIV